MEKASRKSLYSGFHDADSEAIIAWNRRMQELVKMDEIAAKVYSRQPAKDTPSLQELTKIQQSWLEKSFPARTFLKQCVFSIILVQLYREREEMLILQIASILFPVRYCMQQWKVYSIMIPARSAGINML